MAGSGLSNHPGSGRASPTTIVGEPRSCSGPSEEPERTTAELPGSQRRQGWNGEGLTWHARSMPSPGLFADLEWRGLVHQWTGPALAALLDDEPVAVYHGVDPTSDSLHLGSLVGLVALMRFQRAGHRPIALAGGATGMVGDPSERAEERQLLTADVLAANVEAIRAQLGRFLDFGRGGGSTQALLVDNAEWLGGLGLLAFLRDTGRYFTVNAMIAKESVKARLNEREQGISFTEFSYMLLQAYDFCELFDRHACRLQVGGSDQWGNITAGIDLVRRRRGVPVYGLTWPLVLRPDGTKFGKSESGANVWLDARRTSPYAMYQFLMRTGDAMVGTYLRYYTFRSHDELGALDQATATQPGRREAQRALAHDVVALVHGEAEAGRAAHASTVLFTEDIRDLDEATLLAVTAEAPCTDLTRSELDGMAMVDLLVRTGLEPSRGAARRTIEQGGASVNNRKMDVDATFAVADLIRGRYAIVRKGKSRQHLVRAS